MAIFYPYKCKSCGYTVCTEPNGEYYLLSGSYVNYCCANCKQIVSIPTYQVRQPYALPKEPTCPTCGKTDQLTPWNPTDGLCPRCGGEMEQLTDLEMFAD